MLRCHNEGHGAAATRALLRRLVRCLRSHVGRHLVRYHSTTSLWCTCYWSVLPISILLTHQRAAILNCTFHSFLMAFVCLCNPDLASISMLTLFVTSPHVASEYRLLVRPSIIDPSHITMGCDLVGCTFLPHSMLSFYYETQLSSPAPCRS